jgi:hypothetical protein
VPNAQTHHRRVPPFSPSVVPLYPVLPEPPHNVDAPILSSAPPSPI